MKILPCTTRSDGLEAARFRAVTAELFVDDVLAPSSWETTSNSSEGRVSSIDTTKFSTCQRPFLSGYTGVTSNSQIFRLEPDTHAAVPSKQRRLIPLSPVLTAAHEHSAVHRLYWRCQLASKHATYMNLSRKTGERTLTPELMHQNLHKHAYRPWQKY